MVKRNSHLAKLSGSYLFTEIERQKQLLLEKEPAAKLISLGTGDTSEPLPACIVDALTQAAKDLGTLAGYRGYGPDCGLPALRKALATSHYNSLVSPEEIFISDGAGCDISRFQMLFGAHCSLAVQDPSYPAYVDNGVIIGQTGSLCHNGKQYEGISYLSCLPENAFFPDLNTAPRTDIIAFCSPNNPTGSAANRAQLQQLVDFALQNRSILLYDAVYTPFIQSEDIPATIYEIPGARRVAIECHSFSKSAGFTGIRLGWSVVPKELVYDDGYPLFKDWARLTTTAFNGASLISQAGGLSALTLDGKRETEKLIAHYHENGRILRNFFEEQGFETYGGVHAPYLWIRFPGENSWDVFREILNLAHVVTLPGSGFGPAGENFIRCSAFGHRGHIEEAIVRLGKWAEQRQPV